MPFPFAAAEVLTAANLNAMIGAPTQNNQTGTTYTMALLDAGKTVTLNNASAVTVTVPLQATVAWTANTQLNLLNIGAGTVTIVGAGGVTINGTPLTLATSKGGSLVRTASNVWTFIPFSSGVAELTTANISGTTGAPTIVTSGGFTTYQWTGTGSITFGASGLADIAVVGGGGGGGAGSINSPANGGGGGGVQFTQGLPFYSGTFVVAIGGGGGGGASNSGANGSSGNTSYIAGHVGVLGGGFGGGGTNTGGSLATGGGRSGTGLNGWGFGASAASRSGGGGAGVATTTINGGNGKTVSILTAGSTVYGGGGGGGVNNTGGAGTGGTGGGGNGGANAAGGGGGTAGTANTGGGGGGAGSDAGSGYSGYNGGSGLIIIRVRA